MKRLIGELGLRYRPSAQADLEAHGAAVALLARDLADIPVAYLKRAIDHWVLQSPFLPKASDLAALAHNFLKGDQPDRIDWVEKGNTHLREIGRTDIRWTRDEGGELKLEPTEIPRLVPKRSLMDRRGEAMTAEETEELNTILAGLGATARYRPDGSRYMIEAPH